MPMRDDAGARRAALRFWCTLAPIYAVVATIFTLLRAPSPFLFAGVFAGAVGALRLRQPQILPGAIRDVGLAAVGVAAGAAIDRHVIDVVVASPLTILGGVTATLA